MRFWHVKDPLVTAALLAMVTIQPYSNESP